MVKQDNKPNFNQVLDGMSDWHMQAICETAPDHFEAFIQTKHGSYCLGAFATRSSAEAALKDAEPDGGMNKHDKCIK